jgi:hypothetical protein
MSFGALQALETVPKNCKSPAAAARVTVADAIIDRLMTNKPPQIH